MSAFFVSLSVREDGLQWAWSKGLISGVDAYSKHPIQVIHTGTWNRFAPGPDFRNACIRIGEITWYGDVEIHVKSSDWVKHKHQTDPKYRNVILHVVAENDQPLAFNEELIPTIVVETQIISNLTYWNKKMNTYSPVGLANIPSQQISYIAFGECGWFVNTMNIPMKKKLLHTF
jgi:hypothetical protein